MKHARMWYCVAMLLLVSSVFASNGTQIGTVGAKSTAMGSCFRGLADDWSAMYFNPAGLTQLGEWTVGMSTGLISPRGSYTPAQYPYNPSTPSFPNAALYTDQRDLVKKNFFVPALGLFKRASEKMVVGIGVYAPFGLGTEFDLYHIPDGFNNLKLTEEDLETFSDHQVITVQPTVAYQITPKLSVGAGFMFTWGTMTINQTMFPLLPVMSALRNPAFQALAPLIAPNGNQTHFIVTNKLKGDGFSYGVNVGAKYNLLDNLSIGVSGRICTPLKLKGSAEGNYYFPYDKAKFDTMMIHIGPLPDALFGGAGSKQTLMASYSGQEVPAIYSADVEADLPLPWTIGGGIAYKPIPSLTITADASLTNWASFDSVEIKLGGGESEKMLMGWKNTLEIGGGVEWKAWENDCMKLFLRGGFYTVDTPAPDKYSNPTILDPARRNVATAGIGVNYGKFKLDFAFEDVMFSDHTVADYNISSATGHALNYAGLFKMNAKVFTLGLSAGL